MTNNKNRCVIRESDKLRGLLNARFKQLSLTARDVTIDANRNGRKFNEQQLSRYRNHGNINNGVSTSDLIWLCDKYCIELKLRTKKVKQTERGINAVQPT